MPTPDFYGDTERRYRDDAEFRAAVDMLQSMARLHGFTPGELKQIAFKAALELELRSGAPRASEEERARGRGGEGHETVDVGVPGFRSVEQWPRGRDERGTGG